MEWDFDERHSLEWNEHGADYKLTYTYWAYNDPYERQAGSGIRNICLYITKGKHEIGEIEVEMLSKRNQAKYEKVAQDEEYYQD